MYVRVHIRTKIIHLSVYICTLDLPFYFSFMYLGLANFLHEICYNIHSVCWIWILGCMYCAYLLYEYGLNLYSKFKFKYKLLVNY